MPPTQQHTDSLLDIERDAMSAGKASPPPSTSSIPLLCSLQGSLLILAILTLISFTFFSLNSTSIPSPSPSTPSSHLLLHNEDHKDNLSDIYHSPHVFGLNYAEMEKKFKVYIYPDGDPNTFYQTPRKLTGKYASEGYFFQNIRDSIFRTHDPDQAHLFFIPISCHKMRGQVCPISIVWLLRK
jgi:hypothetical protein